MIRRHGLFRAIKIKVSALGRSHVREFEIGGTTINLEVTPAMSAELASTKNPA
jgi:hypothetical protein